MPRFLTENASGDEVPWGHIVLGTFLVQIVAFAGLVFTTTLRCCSRVGGGSNALTKFLHADSILYRIAIPSFAMGAIMATASFLLIPESVHAFMQGALEEHPDDEHNAHTHNEDNHLDKDDHGDELFIWKFGTCLLAGFIFPALASFTLGRPACCSDSASPKTNNNSTGPITSIDTAIPAPDKDSMDQKGTDESRTLEGCIEGNCSICNEDEDEGEELSNKRNTDDNINWALAFTILFGDGLCNFVDGVFIGTAFLLCDQSTAYAIVATTIYHELAQEIADYAILTQQCGFSSLNALGANFLVGGLVIVGAIIVVALEISHTAIGCILVFSAGVYLYICGVEMLPRIKAARGNDTRKAVIFFASFALGAVPIGLVLLNHGHCAE